MASTRREHLLALLYMFIGALFTSAVILSLDNTAFSIPKLAILSIAGCFAGFGIREVFIRYKYGS